MPHLPPIGMGGSTSGPVSSPPRRDSLVDLEVPKEPVRAPCNNSQPTRSSCVPDSDSGGRGKFPCPLPPYDPRSANPTTPPPSTLLRSVSASNAFMSSSSHQQDHGNTQCTRTPSIPHSSASQSPGAAAREPTDPTLLSSSSAPPLGCTEPSTPSESSNAKRRRRQSTTSSTDSLESEPSSPSGTSAKGATKRRKVARTKRAVAAKSKKPVKKSLCKVKVAAKKRPVKVGGSGQVSGTATSVAKGKKAAATGTTTLAKQGKRKRGDSLVVDETKAKKHKVMVTTKARKNQNASGSKRTKSSSVAMSAKPKLKLRACSKQMKQHSEPNAVLLTKTKSGAGSTPSVPAVTPSTPLRPTVTSLLAPTQSSPSKLAPTPSSPASPAATQASPSPPAATRSFPSTPVVLASTSRVDVSHTVPCCAPPVTPPPPAPVPTSHRPPLPQDPRFALPSMPQFRPPAPLLPRPVTLPYHMPSMAPRAAATNTWPAQQRSAPMPPPAPAPTQFRALLDDMTARPHVYEAAWQRRPKPHKVVPGFRVSRSVPMKPAARMTIPTLCTTPPEWFGGDACKGHGIEWVERKSQASMGVENEPLRHARQEAERQVQLEQRAMDREARLEQRRLDQEWEREWIRAQAGVSMGMLRDGGDLFPHHTGDDAFGLVPVKMEVVDSMDMDPSHATDSYKQLTPDEINQRKTDLFYANWKYVAPKSQAWLSAAQKLREINSGQRKRSRAAQGNVRPGKTERQKKRGEKKRLAAAEAQLERTLTGPRVIQPYKDLTAASETAQSHRAMQQAETAVVMYDADERGEAELRAEHALAELKKEETKKKKKKRPNQRQRLVRFLARNIPPLPEEIAELILVFGIRNSKKRRTRNLINVLPSLPNRAKMLAEGRTRFVNPEQATKRGGRYLLNLDMREERNDPLLTNNRTFMYYASKWGKVESLDWWRDWWLRDPITRKQPHYDANALIAAARAGHVQVLEWWRKNQVHFPPKHSYRAIAWASRNGHVAALEWWYKHSRPSVPVGESITMMYSGKAMDWASEVGQIKVLEWWRSKGLARNKEDRVKLKYSPNSMGLASRKGRIDVLDWWVNSKLKLKYSTSSLKWATENGRLDVLDWWKDKMMDPKYPQIKRLKYNWFTYAKAGKGRPGAREWWAQNAVYWAMPKVTRKRQAKQALRRKRRKKARAQRRSLKQIRANKHPRFVMRNGIPTRREVAERREGRKLPVAPPTPPMRVIEGDGFEEGDLDDAIAWGAPILDGPRAAAASSSAATSAATTTQASTTDAPSTSAAAAAHGRGIGSLLNRLFGFAHDHVGSIIGAPSSSSAAHPPPPPLPLTATPAPAPLQSQPPLPTQQSIVTTATMVEAFSNPQITAGVNDDLELIFGAGPPIASNGTTAEPDLLAMAPLLGVGGGGLGGGTLGLGLGVIEFGGGLGAIPGLPSSMLPSASLAYQAPSYHNPMIAQHAQIPTLQQQQQPGLLTPPQQVQSNSTLHPQMPGVRPAANNFAPVAPSYAGLPPRPRPPNMGASSSLFSNTFRPMLGTQVRPQHNAAIRPPRPPAVATPQNQMRPPSGPPGAYGHGYGGYGYPGYGGW